MSKIVITGSKLEECNSETFNKVMSKPEWPVKPGYWLGRIMDHVISELKAYFEDRNKIIDKYALRYDEDTESQNEKGIVTKHKKGEVKTYPNGNKMIAPDKIEECKKEFDELSGIEIEIPVNKISASLDDFEAWDKERGLKLSPAERCMLTPFFEVKE